jgi:hypothetical protein
MAKPAVMAKSPQRRADFICQVKSAQIVRLSGQAKGVSITPARYRTMPTISILCIFIVFALIRVFGTTKSFWWQIISLLEASLSLFFGLGDKAH